MNDLSGWRSPYRPAWENPREEDVIDLRRLVRSAWSLVPLATVSVLACLALGIAYLALAPRTYATSADLLVGGVSSSPTVDVSALPEAIVSDSEILSQMEIVRSDALALDVVDALALADDAEFLDQPAPLADRIKAWAKVALGMEEPSGPPSTLGADARRGIAAALLRSNLDVSRVGRTYVVSVGYRGMTADRTFAIATAYTDAYAWDRRESDAQAAARTAERLADRTLELEGRLETIDAAAERLRAETGLTLVGDTSVLERQVSDLSASLSASRTRVSSAEAALSALTDGPAGAGADADTAARDATDAEIVRLERERQRVEDQFGPAHPRLAVIDAALGTLGAQASRRRTTLEATARAELEAARGEEAALERRLAAITRDNATANDNRARVAVLTRQSAALQTVYETLSARAEEAAQRGRYATASVRILSRASRPTDPATPRTVPVLVLSVLAGLALAGLVAGLRWLREPTIGSGRDAHERLGAPYLGTLAPRRATDARTLDAVRWALTNAVPADPAQAGPSDGDPATVGFAFDGSVRGAVRRAIGETVRPLLPPDTTVATVADWNRWAETPGPPPAAGLVLVLPRGRVAGSAVLGAFRSRPDWERALAGVLLFDPPGRRWTRRRERADRRAAKRSERSPGPAATLPSHTAPAPASQIGPPRRAREGVGDPVD